MPIAVILALLVSPTTQVSLQAEDDGARLARMLRSEGQVSVEMKSNGGGVLLPKISRARGSLTPEIIANAESQELDSALLEEQDEDVEIFPSGLSEVKRSDSKKDEHLLTTNGNHMLPKLELHGLDFNGGCSHAVNKVVKIMNANKQALDSPDGKKFLQDLGQRGEGMLKVMQRIINFFTTLDSVPSHEILTIDDIDALVACETQQKTKKIEEPQKAPEGVTLKQGDMAECSVAYPPEAINGLPQVKGKDKVARNVSKASLVELDEVEAAGAGLGAGAEGVAVTWYDGRVSYCFHKSADDITIASFRAAIKRIVEKVPCFKVKEVDISSEDPATCEAIPSILVTSANEGCWSYIGQVSGRAGCSPIDFAKTSQTMNLGKGCAFVGAVEHQLGHALGMVHEQTRHDRDRYLSFHKDNLDEKTFDANFPISSTDYNETMYDYYSIMHAGAFAFSTNQMETVEPIDPKVTRDMGQREGFSQFDIEHLSELYGCLHKAKIGLTNVKLAEALNTPPDEQHCEDSFPSGIANVATGDDIPCTDLEERCNHAEFGFQIRMACPKTCEVCFHPEKTTPPPTATGAGAAKKKWACEDELDKPSSGAFGGKSAGELQCPKYKQYCETHMDIKLKCAKTCGNCPSCQDGFPGYQIQKNGVNHEATCKELADAKKCTDGTYGDDIKNKCPASCGLCSATPPDKKQKDCQDMADPRLNLDGKSATCAQLESYCNSEVWGEELKAKCPQTCRVPCVKTGTVGKGDCQDQFDSGFKLSSGHMASCKLLGEMRYCYNKKYGAKIRENCPATCRVCKKHGGTGGKGGGLEGCQDKEKTGISLFSRPAACPDLAIFCQHPDMVTSDFSDLLLDVQRTCPLTCNTCSADDPYMKQVGSVGAAGAANCKDNGPVRNAMQGTDGGSMDLSCAMVAQYMWCDHFSKYEQKKMKQICPASCNACADAAEMAANGGANGCYDHEDTQFYFDSSEGAAKCEDLRSYCAHPVHGEQVRHKCCKMCSNCEDVSAEKLGLQLYDKPAGCADLESFCHSNNTHQDMLIEKCAKTCKTCFNRRRRRSTRQHVIEW